MGRNSMPRPGASSSGDQVELFGQETHGLPPPFGRFGLVLTPHSARLGEDTFAESALDVEPVIEVEALSVDMAKHTPEQSAADVGAATVAGFDAVVAECCDGAFVVGDDRREILAEDARSCDAVLALGHLNEAVPAKADVGTAAVRIDEVADLDVAAVELAAMASDPTVRPGTVGVGNDVVTEPSPESGVIESVRMDVD